MVNNTNPTRELEKIKKCFEEAYRKTKNTAQLDGVKYSLSQFEDGTRFVEIDQEQDRFVGHSVDDYPRIAKDIINENRRCYTGHHELIRKIRSLNSCEHLL